MTDEDATERPTRTVDVNAPDGTDGRYRAMTYYDQDDVRVTILQDRRNENAWLQSTQTVSVDQ